MRFITPLFLFTLLYSCEVGEIQDKSHNMAENIQKSGRSIVFYNVENLFDTKHDPQKDDEDFTPYGEYQWDEERYQDKLEHISEAINMIDHKPVLIGLAEVENYKVLEALIETDEMAEVNYKFVHYESPDRRGIDCALLYDADLFKVIRSEKIPVKMPNDDHFATRDILHVFGEFNDGTKTHVFVNHWSSRREGEKETEPRRIQAAEILRSKVDVILKNDPFANVMIIGDFNDYPTNKSLHEILRAKEAGFENGDDLINLLFEEQIAGEGTSVHQREWNVLDQIIISQAIYDNKSGLGIEDNDAEILDEEELIYTYKDGGSKPSSTYGGRKYYGGYSDHLPVYVVLK